MSNHAPIVLGRIARLLARSAALMHAHKRILPVTLPFTVSVPTISTVITPVQLAIHLITAIEMNRTMLCDKDLIAKLPRMEHHSRQH